MCKWSPIPRNLSSNDFMPSHWSPTNSDHVHQLLGGEAAAHAIHQTKAVIPGGFWLQWHKEMETHIGGQLPNDDFANDRL